MAVLISTPPDTTVKDPGRQKIQTLNGQISRRLQVHCQFFLSP